MKLQNLKLHRPTIAGWLIILGSTVGWIWAPMVLITGSPLNTLSSYVSELSARDQDFHLLYRSLDILAGIGLILGGLLAARSKPLRLKLGYLALAIAGAATIADALMPLQCTASMYQVCAAADLAGTLDWMHRWHIVSSSVVAFATIAALLILTRWKTATTSPEKALRLLAIATLLITMLASAEAMRQGITGSQWTIVGIGQRIQLLLTGAWIALIGYWADHEALPSKPVTDSK